MIYILYSADYELFFGKNFVPESEVLIRPTGELLGTCDELGIRTTLFVDTCCLKRYRELGLTGFPDLAEDQIRAAVAGGHDAQSHLHPHWFHAGIHDGGYGFDASRFLLGRSSENPAECTKLVSGYLGESRRYLEGVIRPVDASYRCMSFRAGGYGLQPNEHLIIQALRDTGYLIDSSIVPGLVSKTDVNEIDYRGVPRQANYWLSARTGLAASAENPGSVFEIPVASWKFSFPGRWPHLVRLRLGNIRRKRAGVTPRGIPIQGFRRQDENAMGDFLRKIFVPQVDYLDLHVDPFHLFEVTRKYLAYHAGSPGDIFFSFNMHPKVLGKQNFEALRTYHRLLTGHYGDSLRSITFREAGNLIRKDGQTGA